MSTNAWGSNVPVEVSRGGTGATTLTDGGILLGSGTSAVTPTSQPTDGQLLIGSTGGDPALGVPSGDSNEITIAGGSGTLSIGIADNPVLPGSASVTIPSGATGSEPAASNGMLRYDTTTNKLRAVENTTWVDVIGGGSGGAWTRISQTDFSNDASIEFDNSTITSTYDIYVFSFNDIVVQTDNTRLEFLLSNDNGSSYHVTGYDSKASIVASGVAFATTTTTCPINTQVGNNTNEGFWGWVHVAFPTNASYKTKYWSYGGQVNTAGTNYSFLGSGQYTTAEDNDAIIFSMSSGNIVSGSVTVYGISST